MSYAVTIYFETISAAQLFSDTMEQSFKVNEVGDEVSHFGITIIGDIVKEG